jgi:glucosamine--fructose-6-phosphate aminotransferase (isomerizing)
MCGIVGSITKGVNQDFLINGLKELEYRGYDSAGIAILSNEKLNIYKAVGKLENLESKLNNSKFNIDNDEYFAGIGHTRWATHGKPTELNAHPHIGEFSYVVHNGIIENYKEIKDSLTQNGVNFVSQTDTEVIVHLFESFLAEELKPFEAFQKTVDKLEGAYAILLITKACEKTIFFAKKGSPLIIANDSSEVFFSSSDTPLIGYKSSVAYLDDGVYGYASIDKLEIFKDNQKIELDYKTLPQSKQFAQKDGYRFFMEKEIYEQSSVVLDTLLQRVSKSDIEFDEIDGTIFENINEIKLCACGTSYHAALTASYLFERYAKIRCSVEIASEFRYKEPFLSDDMLFIVISQSGETADTLEALKMANSSGLKSIAICNVDNSSMVREASYSILTRAGIEKGVASTKAFATQVLLLWMLSVYSSKIRKTLSSERIQKEIDAMLDVSNVLKIENKTHEKLKRLSKRYLHGHGFFFIGRDIFYPLALEGALKLKEISYLHAEGYPSGEMKHGPIALADPELFTVALVPKNSLYEKIKSNVEEIIARDSTVCVVSPYEFDLADDFIRVKEHNHIMLEFFEMMVVEQLLSMEISIRLGNDVDMPRNLAKSVTVE